MCGNELECQKLGPWTQTYPKLKPLSQSDGYTSHSSGYFGGPSPTDNTDATCWKLMAVPNAWLYLHGSCETAGKKCQPLRADMKLQAEGTAHSHAEPHPGSCDQDPDHHLNQGCTHDDSPQAEEDLRQPRHLFWARTVSCTWLLVTAVWQAPPGPLLARKEF